MPVGRNAPCPCGSGRKFKHCCGKVAGKPAAAPAGAYPQIQAMMSAGNFAEVLAACDRELKAGKDDFLLHRLRADAAARLGEFAIAHEAYGQALRHRPGDVVTIYNAGTAALRLERFDEAAGLLEKALRKKPDDKEILESLGVAHAQMGHYREAEQIFHRLISKHPRHSGGYLNLAVLQSVTGELDAALGNLERAEALGGETLQTVLNRGMLEVKRGRPDEAIVLYQRLLTAHPNELFFLESLEAAKAAKGDWEGAAEVAAQILEVRPGHRGALCRRAYATARSGDLDAALAMLAPYDNEGSVNVDIQNTFARCYSEFGLVKAAVARYRRIVAVEPLHPGANSSGIFLRHYLRNERESTLVDDVRRYMAREEQRQPPLRARKYRNHRRLRLGFVSADLRRHSVGYFMRPIFEHLDAARYDIYVYDNAKAPDDMTAAMQQYVQHWRRVESLSDEKAASLIQEDEIDILVDLSGLSAGHRLPLFARKPAPVQVTWVGYPATTGLSRMDYRIADALTDPPGLTDQWYSEALWRLPEVFSVYEPPAEAPEVRPTPALSRDYITFGTFNNFNKLNDRVLALWARILQRVEGSRLLLKSFSFKHEGTRDYVWAFFESLGIERTRIDILPPDKGLQNHLARYGNIDIALDPFPYCGTATTCEALWMGLPVISLVGETHRSRVGLSQLTSVGLPELAVEAEDAYLEKAVELAGDVVALDRLRQSIRGRMADSPLTDAQRFVRHLQAAFDQMYEQAGS